MYIRRVKKRNGHSKKQFEYLYLVESIKTPKGPRQRLVLNLGNIPLKAEDWTCFVRELELRLSGQQSLIEIPVHLKEMVEEASHRLIEKQSKETKGEKKEEESQEISGNYQSVDIESIAGETVRSIGAEYVCHQVYKALKIDHFLKEQTIPEATRKIIETLIVGRLVKPGSERKTREWAQDQSGIKELTKAKESPSLSSYYRAGDRLLEVKEELEAHLRKTEIDLFNLKETIILYDLTNTYLEGRGHLNPKAKYGRSKEKRRDCKLLTLGLVVDEKGFAKQSKLYEGNIGESNTLSDMVGDLNKTGETRATVVMDAGIATKENVDWLKKTGYHYVVVNRGKGPVDMDRSEMQVLRSDPKKGIDIRVKRYEEDKDVYLLCWSKQKQKKEEGIRSRQEQNLVEQLAYYKEGLIKKRRTKKHLKVLELIVRLKQKYPKASQLYDIEVIAEKKQGEDIAMNATDIQWKKKEKIYEKELQEEGSYVLRSDRQALSDAQLWQLYIMLNGIESAFKSMKSHLGLRPLFHQKEKRCDAHMFISVIAYHILHIIEYRLRASEDYRHWGTIRDVLSTHQRFTLSFRMTHKNGSIKQQFIRKNSKPEPNHVDIYRALGLSSSPLKNHCSVYEFLQR